MLEKKTLWVSYRLTLKQTVRENGSVTRTSAQDMAVRSQPHRPMPLSDSSAGKEKIWLTHLIAQSKNENLNTVERNFKRVFGTSVVLPPPSLVSTRLSLLQKVHSSSLLLSSLSFRLKAFHSDNPDPLKNCRSESRVLSSSWLLWSLPPLCFRVPTLPPIFPHPSSQWGKYEPRDQSSGCRDYWHIELDNQ